MLLQLVVVGCMQTYVVVCRWATAQTQPWFQLHFSMSLREVGWGCQRSEKLHVWWMCRCFGLLAIFFCYAAGGQGWVEDLRSSIAIFHTQVLLGFAARYSSPRLQNGNICGRL